MQYAKPSTIFQISCTANWEDGAWLHVVAREFWGRNWQCAFFDIKVFNLFVCSYSCSTLSQCYAVNEQEKHRAYDERIHEVERACFSSLAFLVSCGMGPLAITVYSKLASILADKWDRPYSHCMFCLHCQLCFSLLRSDIMYIRSHRSVAYKPIPSNVDLAYSEAQLTS